MWVDRTQDPAALQAAIFYFPLLPGALPAGCCNFGLSGQGKSLYCKDFPAESRIVATARGQRPGSRIKLYMAVGRAAGKTKNHVAIMQQGRVLRPFSFHFH